MNYSDKFESFVSTNYPGIDGREKTAMYLAYQKGQIDLLNEQLSQSRYVSSRDLKESLVFNKTVG